MESLKNFSSEGHQPQYALGGEQLPEFKKVIEVWCPFLSKESVGAEALS